jgi:hypothetical protein
MAKEGGIDASIRLEVKALGLIDWGKVSIAFRKRVRQIVHDGQKNDQRRRARADLWTRIYQTTRTHHAPLESGTSVYPIMAGSG